jgi:hypothetical protein
MSGLTRFHAEVAQLFFSLPASDGFLLAGGAALLANELTTRPTDDLDFFGQRDRVDIPGVRDQFEAAIARRGWSTTRIQDGPTFVRLRVAGAHELLVDIAIDSPPARPPVVSVLGPTFHPEELAGRKLAALFGRAEARDFADVYVLVKRFGRTLILKRALQVDLGINLRMLAEMMRTLDRFDDSDIPIASAEVGALRVFFADWVDELEHTAQLLSRSAQQPSVYSSWDDVPEPFRSQVLADIDELADRLDG